MLIGFIHANGSIEVADHKQLFPEVSFGPQGPDEQFLNANNCKKVKRYIEHNKQTHRLQSVPPYQNGNYIYVHELVEKTEAEIAQEKEHQWSEIRAARSIALKECDWTHLPDNQLTAEEKQEWATYRQALRDITEQEDPYKVVWPTAPGSIELRMQYIDYPDEVFGGSPINFEPTGVSGETTSG
jgi:hypothetical protein